MADWTQVSGVIATPESHPQHLATHRPRAEPPNQPLPHNGLRHGTRLMFLLRVLYISLHCAESSAGQKEVRVTVHECFRVDMSDEVQFLLGGLKDGVRLPFNASGPYLLRLSFSSLALPRFWFLVARGQSAIVVIGWRNRGVERGILAPFLNAPPVTGKGGFQGLFQVSKCRAAAMPSCHVLRSVCAIGEQAAQCMTGWHLGEVSPLFSLYGAGRVSE